MFDAATVDLRPSASAWPLRSTGRSTASGRHVQVFDGDGDLNLVFHFLALLAGFDGEDRGTLRPHVRGQAHRARQLRPLRPDFAGNQDWTLAEG
jgi:hypothetical protein